MELSQAQPGLPAGAAAAQKSIDDAVYRKVTWRIIPFLMVCYIVAYLDRVNVGFAKLQMLADLQFSETVYGLGAGVFFLGYFLFEVPSNVMLHKIGARVWIARIMITWGIISGAFMFVTTPTMFYIMRFLLGVAEAGFFPGIILYLTYWYPVRAPRTHGVHLHGGDSHRRPDRRTTVGLDHGNLCRRVRLCRLAMDVRARSDPRRDHGHRRAAVPGQQHPLGEMADGRRKSASSNSASRRKRRARCRIRRSAPCLPIRASG